MERVINIYCDESCHLERDRQLVMILGAIWCPSEMNFKILSELREIKKRHGLSAHFEIKWTKVSPAKLQFYLELVDYFFENDSLHFRALIAPKHDLRHAEHSQTHDEWYYKMYFDMLKVLLSPRDKYRVYIDIKDSRGGEKVSKLHDVLCNNMYDFSRAILERVQIIQSRETEILQLADLLIGAVSYENRGLTNNSAKVALVTRMKERSGYSLTRSTLIREEKVNLFRWEPRHS